MHECDDGGMDAPYGPRDAREYRVPGLRLPGGPLSAEEPPPEGRRLDPSAIALLLAFAGMLLLTLTPVAGRWTEIPLSSANLLLGAAVILLVAGAVVGIVVRRG